MNQDEIQSMKMAQMVLEEVQDKLSRIGHYCERHDENKVAGELEESKKTVARLEAEVAKLLHEKQAMEVELKKLQGKDPYDYDKRTTGELRDLHEVFDDSRKQVKRLLDDRTKKLEDITTCVVCADAERIILLEPCTHLALCAKCSDQISLCPICRTVITGRVVVKIS